MRKLLLLLLAAPVVFIACNNSTNGDNTDEDKKVKIGDDIVYYKGDDVSETDARNLEKYLAKADILGDVPNIAQLTKTSDGVYEIRFATEKNKLNDSQKLLLWKTQFDVSENVFDKQKVKIIVTDNKFKHGEELGSIARLKVEEKNTIYYNSEDFSKKDAEKLADFFVEQEYFSGDNAKDVFLTKEGNVPVVRFVVNKKLIAEDEAKFVTAFGLIRDLMQKDVFNGNDVKAILTSVNYEDIKTVPKTTDQQNQTETTRSTKQLIDSVSSETTVSGVIRYKNE